MVLFKHDILKNVVSKKYRDKMFTVILPYDTKYSAINIQGFCLIYIQCFCPRIMILVYKPSVQKNILGYYLRIEIDEHCQRKEICEGKNI